MTDKTSNLVLRVGVGAILFVALLFMFVFNPGENADKFSSENLWEAVHPWHWFFDSVALAGLLSFGLFLTGYLGKAFSFFIDVRKGTIQTIGIISMALTSLFFA